MLPRGAVCHDHLDPLWHIWGYKPKPPKILSPEIQGRHNGIKVDQLPIAVEGVGDRPRWTTLFWVLADFVCSVQPGAADDVAFDGGEHVIEGEAGWQAGGLVEREELEGVGVGSV